MNEVRVGQVWSAMDERKGERSVRVVALEVRDYWNRLVVNPAGMAPTHARVARTSDGRQTSVNLARFRPVATGYRLVEDVTT